MIYKSIDNINILAFEVALENLILQMLSKFCIFVSRLFKIYFNITRIA